jgi:metallophosphoesterase superfamily enzyme
VQPAKPVVVNYKAPTIIIPKGLQTIIVLPDVQFGFLRRVDTGEMLPMHDEAAIDVAAQLVGHIRPSGLVHVGDLVDFSEMSRYLQVEEFFRTTQPALDAAYAWLAKLEAVAGKRKIRTRFVAGNHEKRLSEYVQTNARAAFRLRPAMSTPTDWPDCSLPRLLRFDELAIDYAGEWPGSEVWLVKDGPNPLVVMHDPKPKGIIYASVIAGHTHKVSSLTHAVRSPHGGHLTFTHYEIGCLCSLETNPDKLSLQRTRVPSDRGAVSGWSQGVALVEILEKTGQHQLTFIPIKNGSAMFQGQIFQAKNPKA